MRREIAYHQSRMKHPILARALLPSGFVFPPACQALMARADAGLEPWWLLRVESRLFVDCCVALRRRFPEVPWIPFAVREEAGRRLVACFDPEGTGEPAVWLYDSAEPGRSPWLNRGFRDFDQWLAAVRQAERVGKGTGNVS